MPQQSWPAPAKLNLFLHITGRRDDGYHLLQTVFQFLDYCDELRFETRSDGRIRRLTDLPEVAEDRDLVVRAARLMQETTGTNCGVDIQVRKRLPMGGGLGGGSSDAATVLVALNRIWNLGLSVDRLAGLGERLGADVPVFVRGHAAWAEGIGEQLRDIDPPEPWYLVLVPPARVSTPEIFSDVELTRDCRPITIRDFLAGQGSNVLEPVVRKRYPVVGEALDWLRRFGEARLTGTGGCVFAAFATEGAAREVQDRLPESWESFVAKGVNRSPLFDWTGSGLSGCETAV